MKKNRVRLLFVIIVGFLFFQFLFSIKISEPYPAVIFPGFGRIPVASDKINHTEYQIFAYSSKQNYDIVNTDKLFTNVPRVFVPVMLNNIIKKQNTKTSNSNQQDYVKFKKWISSRLRSIYKKHYYKLEIRKLEVITYTELSNDAPRKVSLKDKTAIIL